MRTGLLCTEASAGMYMGLMPKPGGHDAFINWSDDQGVKSSSSALRVTFTRRPDEVCGEAGNPYGLELMRLVVTEDCADGYVGVGDFHAANDNPTERLDVLNGNVRVRDLPSTTSTSLNFVTVDMNTGLLQQRTLPTPPVDGMWYEMVS
jgi:hypothetical protein